MTRALYTAPSVIVQQGPEVGRDRYNSPIYGPDVRTEAMCWYTHQASSEDNSSGVQTTETYMVQWPPDFYGRVRASDSIELPPIGVFHVDGEPLFQPNGFAVEGYVRANLTRTRG